MVSTVFEFLDKKITVNGLSDDHIFKIISKSATFYEQELLNLIGILPYKEGVFLDIGANIGNHTLFFAKILNRQVISVEPNPVTIQFLVDNIASNYLDKNVTLYDKPIGESLDDLYDSICVSEINLGMHKFTKTDSQSSKITGETIDNIAKDKIVSLIKIDVEGAELSALKGGKHTIEVHKPVLIIEAGSMLEKNKIIRYLAPLGYHLMTIKCATDTLLFVHEDDNVSIYRSVVDAYDNLIFQQSLNKTLKGMNRAYHTNHSEIVSAVTNIDVNINKIDDLIDSVNRRSRGYNRAIELLENNNKLYTHEIEKLKNENELIKKESIFYRKKSDILEAKVEFLFKRIKKANPIVAFFCEGFSEYKDNLNKKLQILQPIVNSKKKKPIDKLKNLVVYARHNNCASYQYIYRLLLSEFTPSIMLNYFGSIRHVACQLKTFDVFSAHILKNIGDIAQDFSNNKTSSAVCLDILKALHYNDGFCAMSVSEKFNIVTPIVDFIFTNSKSKIDDSFIEAIILLFAATDKEHYEHYLSKHHLSNTDIIYHNHFVDYFSSHASLSYQICDKNYEKFLESNLKKGFSYICATFLIKIFNGSDNFNAPVNAFLNLGTKHQRKILDKLKRIYDDFENITLDIQTISGTNIYGYVLVSCFKNARDYITQKHISLLEKNEAAESKELVLFVKQKLGTKNILHSYINEKLCDESLVPIPVNFNSVEYLFDNISKLNIPKSPKDYSCSVIITTHNPDINFLTLSVQSLLNQSVKNIEIIIVDDCSDNTDEIKKLAQKSSNVKYIRSDTNQGAYISRNIAIRQAVGDYIFFQDDDDVSHPQRLEYSVDNLIASGAKIFHTGVIRFSRNGLIQLDTNAIIFSDGPVAMCFHKDTFNKLGEFVLFRSRGDVEYRTRCQKRFGVDSYVSVIDVPLYYALGSSTSLSRTFESGASFYNLEINRNIISEAVI